MKFAYTHDTESYFEKQSAKVWFEFQSSKYFAEFYEIRQDYENDGLAIVLQRDDEIYLKLTKGQSYWGIEENSIDFPINEADWVEDGQEANFNDSK